MTAIVRKLMIIATMLAGFSSEAFHIVGGELEFITVGPGRYIINLIQYFDQAQDENPGPESFAEVYIFSNKDNAVVSTHILALRDSEPVLYTNAECAIDELVTSRVIWSSDTLQLDPQQYADPEGYYLVWERCCRNSAIKNIVSPSSTGMKYVLEIPALWRDEAPFINSSPILFKPLSDYACIDQLYYVEFTGIDPDGDSLVYSLTNLLNTVAVEPLPVPQPKPHIVKDYRSGFESIIPGNPALNISTKGLLTVKPSQTGLFVFSVLVEEYRNGEKLGETRRDFQLLVIDGCLPPDPPVLGYQVPGDPDFNPEEDTLRFQVSDDKRFSLLVTNISLGEIISLRAEGVNFDGEINDIFEFEQSLIGDDQDTLELTITLPGCPPVRDEPVILDIIAGDDACPLPQLDTLRLTFFVEPPPNDFPVGQLDSRTIEIMEDDVFLNTIISSDADQDSIDVSLFLKDIPLDPEDLGLSLRDLEQSPGQTSTVLEWNTDCTLYDFSEYDSFTVGVLLEDRDICEVPNPDTIWLDYSVFLPPNNAPTISIPGLSGNAISVVPEETVSFNVLVEDPDEDEVSVTLRQGDGVVVPSGVQFEERVGQGSIQSQFQWTINCQILEEGETNQFTFEFVGDDFDKCKAKNSDTLSVSVSVEVPFNNAPVIERFDRYELEVNVPFRLQVSARDEDLDTIFLELAPASERPDSDSFSFDPVSGKGEVTQTLTWTPDCSLLRNGEPTIYELTFVTFDERCPVAKLDTTKISFLIKETRELFDNFRPANAFSPNQDGKNDIFTMSGVVPEAQQLPIDNCVDVFQYISIHNRAGKRVFYSESRDFSWDGADLPAGTYYYVIKYSETEYRNFVSLLR